MHNYKNEQNGTEPTPDVGWVAEPSLDDQMYDQKVYKKFQGMSPEERRESLERLLEHNPDRSIVEECNEQFTVLGQDTRFISIEPMTVCYDTTCEICKEEITSWSSGYYVTKADNNSSYICGDRNTCSARIIAQVYKKSVESDELGNNNNW